MKRYLSRSFVFLGVCLALGAAFAADSSTPDRLFNEIASSSSSQFDGLSIVRESALREVALTLGAQAGLRDKSCEIQSAIDKQTPAMDARFRFSSLMMGAGLLPPVISEAKDTVALDRAVIRVASMAYHIDEPAMLIDVAPTWRNWLYVGLDSSNCTAGKSIPDLPSQFRPKDDAERKFLKSELDKAYSAGVAQAQAVFDSNLSRLERTYRGMRRYFELYERGMVSAPQILASTDVVNMDDPNTMIVGNTVIRIAKQVGFVGKPEAWKPLSK